MEALPKGFEPMPVGGEIHLCEGTCTFSSPENLKYVNEAMLDRVEAHLYY
jgi:hypothetical protein